MNKEGFLFFLLYLSFQKIREMKNTAIIVFVSALVLCSMATLAMAQSADTPWPTKYQNNNCTCLSPYSGPAEEPIIKWSLGGPGDEIQPAYSPVIGSDGTIYAAGFNTTDPDPLNATKLLLAINPDGTVKWTIEDDFYFKTTASIDSSGIIYVAGYNNLRAIYPNGTVKWTVAPGPDELNTPAIGPDGTIYVTAAAYYSGVYAYYPDGTEKWRIAPSGQYYLLSRHCPAIGPDGTIYGCGRTSIPGPGYHPVIRAIYPDGTEKWNFTILDSQLYSFVALAIGSDGTIYGAVSDRQSTNSTLYALNPDGTVNWSFKPLYAVTAYSSLAIAPDGTIYLGTVNSDRSDGIFYAINPDGTEKWNKSELTDAITVDSAGTIYVGRMTLPSRQHGVLSAMTPDDGTEKWSHTLKNRFFTDADSRSRPSPAMDSDGTIYAITDDDKQDYELYAFWNIPPEETFTKYLSEGWNFISLPLTPSDNSTASVLAGVSHDAVYRYNATAGTNQFENTSTMDTDTGYFVNVTTAGTWTYSGTAYIRMNVDLKQGLNTVGWLNCSKPISDALSSIDGKYNYVARFNVTTQKFEAYNPHPHAPSSAGFDDFTTTSRGTGYFISMKVDSTLTECC